MQEYIASREEGQRWLQEKDGESKLILDDGSAWEISPHHRGRIKSWVRFSSIAVNSNRGKVGDYRYVLVNTSYEQEVEARYLGAISDKTQVA